MNKSNDSLLIRLWQHLFPSMPDFTLFLNNQCELVAKATAELAAYMNTANEAHANKIIEIERKSGALKAEYMTTLHQSFATPFDREDIYRAFSTLDEVINYINTTITEMRALSLNPDEHTRAMADLLHEGALSLKSGFARLTTQPLLAETNADAARKMERTIERCYRQALSKLFDANHYLSTLTTEQQETAESLDVLMQTLSKREITAVGSVAGFVVEILKRREVYRHMSNTADKIVHAGDVLYDIVVKTS